ncbi:putative uncharacterized protein DDB_G0282129 [Condylostylus longicornis]|uniref:putative uncharacterized protein DDB_G0282129 n=1 Tax=Condylostylus longicornis TaxID=2530218 RepID=UPI00244DD713|nr:putative uncharacterized protein DDB_G0282129 [Condylostylus longicornis]XP_055389476.1 putative uncharacterized protein DDB_G0282129 [Condylostylus longicornis]XP_055389477.1 putative uncharacterized protein DDB_G0282129 [Condylostylus longicornis]XP_055389478.1 putative uncharacterized protein DDB_G0282129 [Condylostylus longicornis]
MMETFIVLGLCFILYEALEFLQGCIHSAAPSTVNQLRESYARQFGCSDEHLLDDSQGCSISKVVADSSTLLSNKLLESKSSLSLSTLTIIDNKQIQLQQQQCQQQQQQQQQLLQQKRQQHQTNNKQNSTFSLHKLATSCTSPSLESVIDPLEISSNPELNSTDTYFSIPATTLSSTAPILSNTSISQQKEIQQEEHQHRLLHEQKQKIRKNLSASLKNFRNSSIEKRSIIASTDSLSSNTPILVHKDYKNISDTRNLNFLSKLSSSTSDHNRVYPSTLSLDRVGVGLIQLPTKTIGAKSIIDKGIQLPSSNTTSTTTITDGGTSSSTIIIDPTLITKNNNSVINILQKAAQQQQQQNITEIPKLVEFRHHTIVNDEKNFKEFQVAERNRINNFKNNLTTNSKNLNSSSCYNISDNYSNNNNFINNKISFKDNDLVNGLVSTAIENNEIIMPKRVTTKSVFSISESLDFQI